MARILNSPLPDFDHQLSPLIPLSDEIKNLQLCQNSMFRILRDRSPQFANSLQIAKVARIDATNICGDRGFLSKILRTTIHFSNSAERPFSFVIKVPTMETVDSLMDGDSFGDSTHNAECDFYELFQSVHLALPEVFHIRRETNQQNGLIFMQDLSESCSNVDIFDSLNRSQCEQIVVQIAHLQTNFDFTQNSRKIIRQNSSVHSTSQRQQFLDKFLSEIGEYGNELCILSSQLSEYATVEFADFVLFEYPKEFSTLVHGDLWTNNILFEKDSNGQITNRLGAIIDWQTVFCGNPLFDLAFLLCSSVEGNLRRQIADQMIDLYYDTLTSNYTKRGKTVKFTRTEAHSLYKLCQVQYAPLIGALLVFFGRRMELMISNGDDRRSQMSNIISRTHMVMHDALQSTSSLSSELANFSRSR